MIETETDVLGWASLRAWLGSALLDSDDFLSWDLIDPDSLLEVREKAIVWV